jgi:hypothetical protein
MDTDLSPPPFAAIANKFNKLQKNSLSKIKTQAYAYYFATLR